MDLASLNSRKWITPVPSKQLESHFGFILMIGVVHIVDYHIKTSNVKKYEDWTQFNIRSILLINLINECNKPKLLNK